jgi:LuxR family maltose regulon positive regulatory protein
MARAVFPTDVRWPPVATATARRPPRTTFPVVRREAAVARLDAAVTRSPVTLVCAPPGAGKTVLASAWAETAPEAVWLSLGRDDARPGVFWWHLLDALSSRLPELDRSRWPRGAEESGGPAVDAVALALYDHGSDTTIVLDGLERVDAAALEDLDGLLTLTGERLRLVILTRVRPRLPLHRYRLEGLLEEIGFDELRLDDAAVTELLARHGLRVSRPAAALLAAATEGWAAGIRLVALSLHDQGVTQPSEQQVRAALAPADTLLADYLRAEVIGPLGDLDRVLLRRLSMVDGFGVGLAELLTGRPQDLASLTDLARRVPFLRRDPHDPDAFRLHPLLRAALGESLRAQRPEEVLALHRSAAEWYAASGDICAAVDQLLRAGDRRGAVGVVVDSLAVADVLIPTPSGSRLVERLVGVTDPSDSPSAALLDAALAVHAGDLERATARMDGLSDAAPGSAALSMALVRARLASAYGDADTALAAVAAGRQELAAQSGGETKVSADALLRMAEASALYAGGSLDDAAALLGETLLCLTDSRFARPRLDCLGRLALVEAGRGKLARALELAEAADRLAADDTALRPPAAALLARAWVAIERQELSRALYWVGKANRVGEVRRDPLLASVSVLLRARSMRDRGDVCTARRLLDGEPPEAPFIRAEREQERARLGLTEPGATTVADHVGTASPAARVEALLQDAHRQCARGDSPAGRTLVIEALGLAEPERLRRPFTHAGAAVHAVMRSHAEVAARTDWLVPSDPVEEARPRSSESEPPVEIALTDRELEVLRHLGEMLSTQEIGSAMFISVNTVRTHVRHILDKLSVTRRNEAVRRARAIGLL